MAKILDNKKREQAFLLYGKYRNVSKVAEEVGVEQSTISRWRKEENWDTKLLDISRRMRGMLAVVERAKNDLAIADMTSELAVLEQLEVFVANAIMQDGLRPTKWSDVLSTMKFVADRKDIIFGKAALMAKEVEEAGKEDATEMTAEDKDKLAAMDFVMKNTATPLITGTEYVPDPVREVKVRMTEEDNDEKGDGIPDVG